MEPKDYLVAVCRRWAWIAGLGVLGAVVGVLLSQLFPPTYTSTAGLEVSVARVSSGADVTAAGQLDQRIVPSFVRLARSAAVLQPVIDGLRLDETPQQLARTLKITVVDDTALVQIAAKESSPGRAVDVAAGVSEHLSSTASALYADADGRSLLRVTTLAPAARPRFAGGMSTKKLGALGLAAGLALGALLSCFGELLRPRVRSALDGAALTAAPVVEVYGNDPRRRAGETKRSHSVERLWWLLHGTPAAAGGGPRRRFAVVGADTRLVHELRAMPGTGTLWRPAGEAAQGALVGSVEVVQVPDPRRLRDGGERFDGIIVPARSGRTSARSVSTALAAAAATGTPVTAVVVDGVLAPGASRRARLLAALRGNAPLGALERLAQPWPVRPGARAVSTGRVTAVVALVLLGLARPLSYGITTGLVAAAVLLPVWVGTLRRYRGAVLVSFLVLLGLVSGFLLAVRSSADHDITLGNTAGTSFLVLTLLGGLGLVLWSRTVLPLSVVGLSYGLGQLVTGILRAPASPDPYKFELALPLTIVVLSLLARRRNPLPALAALAVLGGLDILNDARSAFAFCAVAAALVLWQARPGRRGTPRNRWTGAIALAAAGVGAYMAISELLVSGALGAAVQARTTQQIADSGSLLLGGRPEWTATAALMEHNPLGLGLGIVPNAEDVLVAKNGIAVAHIPTAEGYLEHYLFNGGVELHSVVADLWTNLGLVGLILGITLAVLLVRDLTGLLARRRASALACFLGLAAVWYLAFGPLPSNLPDVTFALGVLLQLRPRAPQGVPAGRRRPWSRAATPERSVPSVVPTSEPRQPAAEPDVDAATARADAGAV